MTWIYNHFKVSGSDDKYHISIADGIGPSDGFDAMVQLNWSQFTTCDSDHDSSSTNCAQHSSFRGKGAKAIIVSSIVSLLVCLL